MIYPTFFVIVIIIDLSELLEEQKIGGYRQNCEKDSVEIGIYWVMLHFFACNISLNK